VFSSTNLQKVAKIAQELLLNYIKKDPGGGSGFDPKALSASALFAASLVTGKVKVTQEHIQDKTSVTLSTVRKHYPEILDKAGYELIKEGTYLSVRKKVVEKSS